MGAWMAIAFLSAQPIDFDRAVRPILRKCVGCHGPAMQMNGLRLDDRKTALLASEKLVQRVASDKEGFRMPPVGPRLNETEIALLRRWHEQSARDRAEAARRHWSFQPVRRPIAPVVRRRDWPRNPIDAFVLARLEKEAVAPSPEAPRATLLRRLSLDLTGLPVSAAEAAEFVADRRPDAYERLVDRLLASPHYGEKWARHWLDLAHYADSDGYEKDQSRPHAWRWRHWVIEALNRDLPFDRFTVEQLAGDLLPGATAEQISATGFLRNTLKNREAGTDRAEARFEEMVNRTNTVGTTWLGLTAGCAQCHDHKYDPISQKEYYQLFAFFHSAGEESIDAPLPGELGPYLRALPEYLRQRERILAEYDVPALQQEWERLVRGAITNPGKIPEWDFALTSMQAMFDGAVRILQEDPAGRTARQRDRLTDYFIRSPGPTIGRDKEKLAKFKELRAKLNELEENFPALSQAMVIERDAKAGPAHLHVKGDWRQLGDAVEPNTLSILGKPLNGKPDRLALARWLVSRENPLTARVTVNRIWQELFGRGLVRTSEDFGTQGEKPSHPELLDWLAAEFVERGWSVKAMIRVIVTSAAYRQSS
ncbi:MAG: PSD1 and planctomycete cytochrome C domain-containing protein, partial [Bryobacteraceae bacterium]